MQAHRTLMIPEQRDAGSTPQLTPQCPQLLESSGSNDLKLPVNDFVREAQSFPNVSGSVQREGPGLHQSSEGEPQRYRDTFAWDPRP